MIKNIALIGILGCGKTTVGKALSEKSGIAFIDLDEYIEKKYNTTINEIFKQGEDVFRKMETEALKEVSTNIPSIISTGGGVIKKQENMEILKENSIIIFINRPIDNIAADIDISFRPLLAEGPSKLYSLYKERYPLYKKYADYEIINDKDVDSIVNEIMKLIKEVL
ncbi:MAG: shikimate kinase [Bacillota bacterium]|nr:shikimate kinase [Bacillota bacterium]